MSDSLQNASFVGIMSRRVCWDFGAPAARRETFRAVKAVGGMGKRGIIVHTGVPNGRLETVAALR